MSATFCISTRNEGRSGDVVVTAGIDLSAHSTNPAVLFDHGRGDWKLPIGMSRDPSGQYRTWLDLRERKACGTCYFSQSNRQAQDIFRLVDSRSAAAVGPFASARWPSGRRRV